MPSNVELEQVKRELRMIRNSVEELTLQVRGETWGMRLRSDIQYLQQAITHIPMAARLSFCLGVLCLSLAPFSPPDIRKILFNIGGNLLLISIALMGNAV